MKKVKQQKDLYMKLGFRIILGDWYNDKLKIIAVSGYGEDT